MTALPSSVDADYAEDAACQLTHVQDLETRDFAVLSYSFGLAIFSENSTPSTSYVTFATVSLFIPRWAVDFGYSLHAHDILVRRDVSDGTWRVRDSTAAVNGTEITFSNGTQDYSNPSVLVCSGTGGTRHSIVIEAKAGSGGTSYVECKGSLRSRFEK